MKKNNGRPSSPPTMPRHESQEKSEPPSPQALIERARAEKAAERNPLAYALGEPLPGRSALDKMRAKQKALDDAEAGVGDNVIELRKPSDGRRVRYDRISPGAFALTTGHVAPHGRNQ